MVSSPFFATNLVNKLVSFAFVHPVPHPLSLFVIDSRPMYRVGRPQWDKRNERLEKKKVVVHGKTMLKRTLRYSNVCYFLDFWKSFSSQKVLVIWNKSRPRILTTSSNFIVFWLFFSLVPDIVHCLGKSRCLSAISNHLSWFECIAMYFHLLLKHEIQRS